MVTTEEIEELIVKLHNEHKTTREISKIVHKNFSYVGPVLRKRFPEEYPNEISKETQALKLFSIKKTPTQVAIELDEKPDSVESILAISGALRG
jgi:predicted methyltransferase